MQRNDRAIRRVDETEPLAHDDRSMVQVANDGANTTTPNLVADSTNSQEAEQRQSPVPPLTEPRDELTGQVIGGRFEVNGLLTRDSFGPLFAALDRKTSRPLSLRSVSSANVASRLGPQLSAIANLTHANLLGTMGILRSAPASESASAPPDQGGALIVQAALEGRSVASLIETRRLSGNPTSLEDACHIVNAVASALTAVHATGPHGAVGPETVWTDETGAVLLTDLVLSRAVLDIPLGDALDERRTLLLAPEVKRGDPAQAASDVYGLSALLYALLTGSIPLPSGAATCRSHAEVTGAVDALIRRGLSVDPRNRPASPEAFRDALREALGTGRRKVARSRKQPTPRADLPKRSSSIGSVPAEGSPPNQESSQGQAQPQLFAMAEAPAEEPDVGSDHTGQATPVVSYVETLSATEEQTLTKPKQETQPTLEREPVPTDEQQEPPALLSQPAAPILEQEPPAVFDQPEAPVLEQEPPALLSLSQPAAPILEQEPPAVLSQPSAPILEQEPPAVLSQPAAPVLEQEPPALLSQASPPPLKQEALALLSQRTPAPLKREASVLGQPVTPPLKQEASAVLSRPAPPPLSQEASAVLSRPAPPPLKQEASAVLSRPAPTPLSRPAPPPLSRSTPPPLSRSTPPPLKQEAPAVLSQPAPAPFEQEPPAILRQQASPQLSQEMPWALGQQAPLTQEIPLSKVGKLEATQASKSDHPLAASLPSSGAQLRLSTIRNGLCLLLLASLIALFQVQRSAEHDRQLVRSQLELSAIRKVFSRPEEERSLQSQASEQGKVPFVLDTAVSQKRGSSTKIKQTVWVRPLAAVSLENLAQIDTFSKPGGTVTVHVPDTKALASSLSWRLTRSPQVGSPTLKGVELFWAQLDQEAVQLEQQVADLRKQSLDARKALADSRREVNRLLRAPKPAKKGAPMGALPTAIRPAHKNAYPIPVSTTLKPVNRRGYQARLPSASKPETKGGHPTTAPTASKSTNKSGPNPLLLTESKLGRKGVSANQSTVRVKRQARRPALGGAGVVLSNRKAESAELRARYEAAALRAESLRNIAPAQAGSQVAAARITLRYGSEESTFDVPVSVQAQSVPLTQVVKVGVSATRATDAWDALKGQTPEAALAVVESRIPWHARPKAILGIELRGIQLLQLLPCILLALLGVVSLHMLRSRTG